MRDHIAELRNHLKAYHETEQDLITTNPGLCESDSENYSDSYKWLSLPIPDEQPETVAEMILLDFELFPNDCLAGILLAVLKNQVPNGIRLNGMSIDRVETSFRFCISGSTSLEALRTLYEQYESNRDFEDKK
jgi:hypothetical protein